MQEDEENKISKARATSSLFLFFQELCNIPVSVMLNGKVLNQKGENVKAQNLNEELYVYFNLLDNTVLKC